MPSQKELAVSIKNILKTADLDSISAKQVRKQLEKEYECDLTEHKKFIDKTIMDLIDEMGSDDDKDVESSEENNKKRSPSPINSSNNKKVKDDLESLVKKSPLKTTSNDKTVKYDSESDDVSSGSDSEILKNNKASSTPAASRKRGTKKSTSGSDVTSLAQTTNSRACKKNSRGSKADVRVSPELAKIIGAEVLPMSEISLRLHQEALSRQLHEGSDKMYIVCDDDFRALFKQERIRVSTLTNHCKKHIFKIEKEKSERKAGNSTYSKKLWLSPTLADVLGYNHMSRHAVVKEMWALIKARDLQDPKNKKFMFVDDDLMPLFKTKRVKSFGMMKYLTGHMVPDEDEFEYSSSYPEYLPVTDTDNGTTQGS